MDSGPLPFVGRDAELRSLEDAFQRVASGAGQIVLVTGEPGIGKTRLVEEFTAFAQAHGALVAWGSCHEWEGAPAYWPWTQALRTIVSASPGDVRTQLEASQIAHLAHIIPKLREGSPAASPHVQLEPEAQLFQLFAAVGDLLRNSADRQPLVLVLDDIHWADPTSLQLLRFLAVDLRNAAVLLVATRRAADPRLDHPANSMLYDLAREPHCVRLTLRGWPKQQVARFVALATAQEQPASFIDVLFEDTDGNPFFVTEVMRLFMADGQLSAPAAGRRLQIPESVRAAIHGRVGRLSPDCRRVLAVAAVAGRDLDVRILERAVGMNALTLFDLLEEAVRAQLIVSAGAPVHFRFSHALVQEALYQELGAAERIRLHLAVGQAIEGRDDSEVHWEELAYHYAQAGLFGDPAKLLLYAERAGHIAMRHFAWEAAAVQYSHALSALGHLGNGDVALRTELLLALGEAQYRSGPGSGDSPAARESFRTAFDQAESLGSSTAMAQAAVGHAGLNIVTAFGETLQLELLERALAGFPAEDSALRVRVLSRLAVDLWNRSTNNQERARGLVDEAVAIATRLDDPGPLGVALWASHFSGWRPDNLDERVATTSKLIAYAEQTGDAVVTSWGYMARALDCIELGDLVAAEGALAFLQRLDERIHIPYIALRETAYRGALALLTGRYADGQLFVERARQRWQSTTPCQYQLQPFVLLRDTDRLIEFTEQLALPSSVNSWRAAIQAHRMWLAIERGQLPYARDDYHALVANDFAGVPFDAYWYGVMIPLAEAAIVFQDTPSMQRIYDALTPYYHRIASVGILGIAHGPVAMTLGRLALALGELDRASEHLERALGMSEKGGMQPYVARTLVALGEVALRQGSSRSHAEAHAYIRRAADVAEAIGMAGLSPHSEELCSAFAKQRATKFGLTARELDVLRLVAEGLTDQEVADRLFLSPRTVGSHLTSIYSRLNVSTRTAAVRIALEHHLV